MREFRRVSVFCGSVRAQLRNSAQLQMDWLAHLSDLTVVPELWLSLWRHFDREGEPRCATTCSLLALSLLMACVGEGAKGIGAIGNDHARSARLA